MLKKLFLKKFYVGTGLVPVLILMRTATRFDRLTVLSEVEGRAVPTITHDIRDVEQASPCSTYNLNPRSGGFIPPPIIGVVV